MWKSYGKDDCFYFLNFPFHLQVVAGGLLGVVTAVVGHLITLTAS